MIFFRWQTKVPFLFLGTALRQLRFGAQILSVDRLAGDALLRAVDHKIFVDPVDDTVRGRQLLLALVILRHVRQARGRVEPRCRVDVATRQRRADR